MRVTAAAYCVISACLATMGCGPASDDSKTDAGPADDPTAAKGTSHAKAKQAQGWKREIPTDFATPQKVAAAITRAYKDRDWNRAAKCLTWKSRFRLYAWITLVDLGKAYDEKLDVKKLSNIRAELRKFGVDDEDSGFFKDHSRFARGMALYESRMSKVFPRLAGSARKRFAAVVHKNFNINGDVATADLMNGNEDWPKTAYFKRIDGQWFVDYDRAAVELAKKSREEFKALDKEKKD